MRASLFVLAAATVLAVAAPASIASAQGVAIEGPGVGVRVGEPDRFREDRFRERRFGEERRIYRDRDRVTVGGEGCRSVTVKKRLPDGSVVVRRRSSC
jgi:hypothetical protein